MERGVSHVAFRERAYGMKKHHATRLHFDLRLEWNGVLLSWAIPKGPDCRVGAVRKAIEMEDHRKAYLLFEGLYETGPIMLWDCGTWEPQLECDDVERSLRCGILRFTLRGEKLKGGWTLARIRGAGDRLRPTWTLSKHADAFARNPMSRCVLEELPNSVSTGKTMEEIVRDWVKPRNRHERQMKLFDERYGGAESICL